MLWLVNRGTSADQEDMTSFRMSLQKETCAFKLRDVARDVGWLAKPGAMSGLMLRCIQTLNCTAMHSGPWLLVECLRFFCTETLNIKVLDAKRDTPVSFSLLLRYATSPNPIPKGSRSTFLPALSKCSIL